jgi:hypothetical protein
VLRHSSELVAGVYASILKPEFWNSILASLGNITLASLLLPTALPLEVREGSVWPD